MTTRAAMPEWAKARESSKPDPEVKQWIADLKKKLFGAQVKGDAA